MSGSTTETRYAALKAAYEKGVRKARYSTGPGTFQEVEYQSIEAMERILARMERELGLAPARPGPVLLAYRKRR